MGLCTNNLNTVGISWRRDPSCREDKNLETSENPPGDAW